MTSIWATILAASLGCYALKLAGVSLPQSVLNHPGVQQIAGLRPVAMLTALIVTDLFDANGHYTADWHTLTGVGAGALALRSGRSLLSPLSSRSSPPPSRDWSGRTPAMLPGDVQPYRPEPRHDRRACPERHPASASRSPDRPMT